MVEHRARPWLLAALPLGACAVIVACTQVVQGTRSASPPKSAPLPVITHLDEAGASHVASSERRLDLNDFLPVLARPDLEEVALAVRDGHPERAAAAMRQWMQGARFADPLEEVRASYVLATLFERSKEWESASTWFERTTTLARERGWILLDLAVESAARLALQLDRPELAQQHLSTLDKEDAALVELRAVALERLGRLEEAEVQWAHLIELLPPTGEAAHRAQLGHARSLWALHRAAPADLVFAPRATEALGRAMIGLQPEDPVYREAEKLQAEWHVHPVIDSADTLLLALGELVENGAFDEAWELAQKVRLDAQQSAAMPGCRLAYLKGKILAGQRKWGEAADLLAPHVARCAFDADMHATLLFNAGKYSAADGRDSAAVVYYEELESQHADDSLADDARLRRAKCYQDMGSRARFVSLLSQMPEDYPDGDMTMEGVLVLALDQMMDQKWSEAASVLQRAASIVRTHDSERGHEYAGTERYFLARAWMELDEQERALSEYEALIRQVPLSYYMLHAYSRLLEANAPRARKALEQALSSARSAPFQFPYRDEYESPEFRRAMELLRVGEVERGRHSFSTMNAGATPDGSLLWGIALLFERAGDAHFSHQLARGRLTDWLAHYPDGDWVKPWEIGFPRPFLDVVERQSEQTGVPPWLIYGVMREESTFVPDIVSPAQAYGLMQVIEPTARGIGNKYDLPHSVAALKTPRYNIAIGSRVLEELSRRFKKNPVLAIPGYNAGPSRPGRWLSERPNIDFDLWVESIPFRETRRYVKRVLASRAAYAFLYYRDSAELALVLPKRLNLN